MEFYKKTKRLYHAPYIQSVSDSYLGQMDSYTSVYIAYYGYSGIVLSFPTLGNTLPIHKTENYCSKLTPAY